MLPTNGSSLENENELLKIVEKAVANYESLDDQINRVGGEKYNANKKNVVAVQMVIGLQME